MDLLELSAILITLTAVFAYINERFFGLPTTVGVMLIALIFSVVLLALGKFGMTSVTDTARNILSEVDFNKTLLDGMLSFLLFAGALHVNLDDLAKQKWVIITLATFGVCLSTFLVGIMAYFGLMLFGIEVSLLYCFLFGALISPTDPIAVLATLKTVGIEKSLETKIAGESLFNDGVGVVVFLVLYGMATSGGDVSISAAATLFAQEALGGIGLGLGLGWITYMLCRSVDNYQVEILLTLALVLGGYMLALQLHMSGPIAMVVAGLMIGNHGRLFAMTEKTREHLDTFWELTDEILNALLFVLIGLEILILDITGQYLIFGVIAIPMVLLARTIAVGLPIKVMALKREFSPNVVRILVWGGIRGGISVALALSLPPGKARDMFICVTYVIVIFSIAVQGLTIKKLVEQVESEESGS